MTRATASSTSLITNAAAAWVKGLELESTWRPESHWTFDRIKAGAKAGWPPADEALIRMADELVSDHFVGQAAWTELRAHFDEEACMDAVFTAGQYVQVSMFLNTFGVQLDSGLALDPHLRAQP